MTDEALLRTLPGGAQVLDWFGHAPHFHDAEILSLELGTGAGARMAIHAWTMTDETDAAGRFILRDHAVVTLTLRGVDAVQLSDFDMGGIIDRLDISRAGSGYAVAWDTAVGVAGRISAAEIALSLSPGCPAP